MGPVKSQWLVARPIPAAVGPPAGSMKFLWLLATIWPAMAQFQSIEVKFEGIGCPSCIESLPGRIQRMRGVESAKVDAGKGVLVVTFAKENRVRIEQIRDAIEQDGTKARSATVSAKGAVAKEGSEWVFRVTNGRFRLSGEKLQEGEGEVAAEIENLRPPAGAMVWKVREFRRVP